MSYRVLSGRSFFKLMHIYGNLLFTVEGPGLHYWEQTTAIASHYSYIYSFNPYKKPLGTVLPLPKSE